MKKILGLVLGAIGLVCYATKELPVQAMPLLPEETIKQLFDPLQDAGFVVGHFLAKEVNRKLLAKYSAEELVRIHADLLSLQEKLFTGASKGAALYVATAGGPGSGKSTVLEEFMAKSAIHFVYADPDRATLLHMAQTYKKDLADKVRTPEEAYTYWRDASNFLANYFLAKALHEGYAVAHGTTMTAPAAVIEKIFTTLKTVYGYKVQLLHINCDQAVRQESEDLRRAGGVVQCTWEDFHNKNKAFFERLPQYLAADQVDFYYRSKLDQVACVASRVDGKVVVIDAVGFKAIRQLHEDFAPGVFNFCLPI